jgi:hypothetical protein
MVPETLAKQMIHFQKASFDNAFNAAAMIQDQTERWLNTLMEQSTWLPAEGRRVADEWVQVCKRGRNDLKTIVDEGYDKVAAMFNAEDADEPLKVHKPVN